MYEKAITDIERFEHEHYFAIREYVYEKALDEDLEFKRIQDNISNLYDEVKIISKMSDGFELYDEISEDKLINQIFQFYVNTRKLYEQMEERMYLRGIRDCIQLLRKADVL